MENKEEIVRKIARKIVDKYALVPPIRFDEIFEAKNIYYREENLGTNGDGYSDLKDSKLTIVINSEIDYEPRKRFTIAHELGHIFIGWHDDVTLCKTDNEYFTHNMLDIQEKEANIFASELLMPYDWVRTFLDTETDMKKIVTALSSGANTSLMAVFYALENAMDAGNVLLVRSNDSIFPKRFVAVHTCNTYLDLKGDFEDTCDFLSLKHHVFSIGSYTITHYIFFSIPALSQIRCVYDRKKNLLGTLNELTDGHIFYLLHCLKDVIDAIGEKYILYGFYNDEQALIVKSRQVEIVLPYTADKSKIIEICQKFDYHYEEQKIEFGFEILVIKEPKFIDNKKWQHSGYNSKTLLNTILNETYAQIDINKKRMSINGVIGSAKSMHKNATREELYDIIQKRMRRTELEDFVNHDRFEEFVSLKCCELMPE